MTNTQTATKEKQSSGLLETRFFQSRTVIVAGEINDRLAQRVVKQLLALAEDGEAALDYGLVHKVIRSVDELE